MPNPRTAAEWVEEYSSRLNQDGDFEPRRGEKLFPKRLEASPLEWMLDAYARQRVEAFRERTALRLDDIARSLLNHPATQLRRRAASAGWLIACAEAFKGEAAAIRALRP